MKVLLVNPPNAGRSIAAEDYGIDSIARIFRGEPLGLETLAGNLPDHEVRIQDLKADPDGLDTTLAWHPHVVGITAMTCEVPAAIAIARMAKDHGAITVVGGVHASNEPERFAVAGVDHVAVGLGKAAFAELVQAIQQGEGIPRVPGIARVAAAGILEYQPRVIGSADLVEERPPRYDLTAAWRDRYCMGVGGQEHPVGFVASACGCPYHCRFCCIAPLTGGAYLVQSAAATVRDIGLLGEVPIIRLVDANSFGNITQARSLAAAIAAAGIRKQFIADVRADTVVRHPDLIREWAAVGLRAVVVGFEEIDAGRLTAMNKACDVDVNVRAIDLLHEAGVTVVGDFIVDPDYAAADFDRLEAYVRGHAIDLPIFAIMTPLPGTPLYRQLRDRICVEALEFYTLTNAVTPTRLPGREFYARYAALTRAAHEHARI